MKKSYKLIMYFLIAFFVLSIKSESVSAQDITLAITPDITPEITPDITQPPTPHVYEDFEYEYLGNILTYRILNIPSESDPGIVAILGMRSSPDLSTELHIPSEVAYLGGTYNVVHIDLLFHGSKYITSVYFPNSITSIPNEGFRGATSLTEIYIPDTVTKIGNAAFQGCTSLKSIKLPKNLTEIRPDTFSGCTNVKNVDIPMGLTRIYSRAFEDCDKLNTLYLPGSITEIDRLAFEGSNITFEVDQDSYASYFCKTNLQPSTFHSGTSATDIPLDAIVMKPRQLTLHSGKQGTLSLQFYPVDTTVEKLITWSSSDPTIATVDQVGSVTAIRPGSAFITAVVGIKLAKCKVFVNPYSPRSISAVPSAIDRITISWAPVKYAKGYHIYRSTNPTKGFKDIAYVNYSFYEDYELNLNTTYYYKVLASNNSSTSYFSEVVSAKPKISVPQITASSANNNYIKLHWIGIRGAKGYNIYRTTSKTGNYKLYKNVATPYFIDTSVSKDKTYYYYVKAYYFVNSSKIYSGKSNIDSAVTKTPPTPKYVTVGTTKSDLYKILGRPYSTNYHGNGDIHIWELFYKEKPWSYRSKIAVFYLKMIDNEWTVFGWGGLYSGIKVSDGNEYNTGTFSLGSTFDQVIKAMPTPKYFEMYGAVSYNYIIQTNWIEYSDGSTVIFGGDKKVIGWENKGSLKIKYGAAVPTHKTLTIGSSLADVLNSLGTPDEIGPYNSVTPATLKYGNTFLMFNEYQKLVGWDNKETLNISIGAKPQIASTAKIGYLLEEVIQVMGTPDTYYISEDDQKTLRWLIYGKTIINFDENEYVTSIQSR